VNSSEYVILSISGSSPTDVWAGGFDVNNYSLFHYDGVQWTGVPIAAAYVKSVIDFNPNSVWLNGGYGEIWFFDGHMWTRNFVYKPNNSMGAFIQDIFGTTPFDVYAVGVLYETPGENLSSRGFILHNDGFGWKEVYRANYYSQFIRVRSESGLAYILGDKVGYIHSPNGDSATGKDNFFIYQFKNGILKQIDSSYIYNGIPMIDNIGDYVYFALPSGKVAFNIFLYDIGRYSFANFVKRFSVNISNWTLDFSGRNEKDVFLPMYDGIAHWNGTDIKYLIPFANNNMVVGNIAVFEKDVFVPVKDPTTKMNLVYHGRLIEEKKSATSKIIN